MGGVGYNPGFVKAIQRELNLETIYISQEPEYGSAVGAAVTAAEKG
jgi:activator of 2-hydroxyglutaryl-CoA dehydratase